MDNNLKIYSDDNFIGAFSSDVFHGFFTRRGGVSEGMYRGLNCGIGSNDDALKVQENRNMVAKASGVKNHNLLSLYQVHGAETIYVQKSWEACNRPKADSFVTDISGIALGILTADCAPILFVGQKENNEPVIGAAHAGWGGALKGVIESTIFVMAEIGAVKNSIRAMVGPCICQTSYEVKEIFANAFIDENEASKRFFLSGANAGHLLFDLSGYCAYRLARAGINYIYTQNIDTYRNENEFYSYRRSTHRSENDYGRQVSVISINN